MRDHRLQKSLASPSSPARPSQCAPSGAHAPKCLGTLRRAVLMGTLCMHVHGLTLQRAPRQCLRPCVRASAHPPSCPPAPCSAIRILSSVVRLALPGHCGHALPRLHRAVGNAPQPTRTLPPPPGLSPPPWRQPRHKSKTLCPPRRTWTRTRKQARVRRGQACLHCTARSSAAHTAAGKEPLRTSHARTSRPCRRSRPSASRRAGGRSHRRSRRCVSPWRTP